MRRFALALTVALLPGMAAAQMAPSPSMPMPMHAPLAPADQIVLQLKAEGWVETRAARVVAVVRQAQSGEAAAREPGRVPAALKELSDRAEWQVTGFDRSRDGTGLERWTITAEARLPESALGGIHDRARALGRPGRQVEIAQVDFSPTLAEREATEAALRADIYRRAQEEVVRAAAVWPERGFRVHRVDFGAPGRPVPAPRMMAERSMAMAAPAAEPADAGSGVGSLSERMTIAARVVLSAAAPFRPVAPPAPPSPPAPPAPRGPHAH